MNYRALLMAPLLISCTQSLEPDLAEPKAGFILPIEQALSADTLLAEVGIYVAGTSPQLEGTIEEISIRDSSGKLFADITLNAYEGDKLLRVYISHQATGSLLWVGEWPVTVQAGSTSALGKLIQSAQSGDGAQFLGDAHPAITRSSLPFGPEDALNIDQICSQNDTRCNSERLVEACNSHGFGFSYSETCTNAPEFGAAACVAGACSFTCENGYHTNSEDSPESCIDDTEPTSCGPNRENCHQGIPDSAIPECDGQACSWRCPDDMHLEQSLCVPNSQECFIQNGTGQERWDSESESWGACLVESCSENYHPNADSNATACVYDFEPSSCGPDRLNCTDSLSCTLENCVQEGEGFRCAAGEEILLENSCLVDSAICYAAGMVSTTNPCQECLPHIAVLNLSPDDTNPYNDGNACTANDRCETGVPTSNAASPAALVFTSGSTQAVGTVVVDSSIQVTVEIQNTGEALATVIEAEPLTGPFSLVSSGDCGSGLAAGASCELVVSVSPTEAGSFEAQLNISYNDCEGTQEAAIQLTASGSNFVLIPAGSFTMGSPVGEVGRESDEAEHQVALTRSFFMQTYEVTQGEWLAVFENNPSLKNNGSCDTCPVEAVNWFEAIHYANSKSVAEGLSECYTLSNCTGSPGNNMECDTNVVFAGLDCPGYRLPTEAEWEYAARAGTSTAFYSGANTNSSGCESVSALETIGWYCNNSGSTTHEVGGKTANAWGLYDMSGNVWEWVWDWSGVYSSSSQTDPLGSSPSTGRVKRGGSFNYLPRRCRSAARDYGSPGDRGASTGFRLARTAP